jgi:arylsulfatase A-like enzyme
MTSWSVVARPLRAAFSDDAALKGLRSNGSSRDSIVRLSAACVVLALSAACSRTGDAPRPRHVLLITIDTLRADRVGAYGYARAHTPRLDALARGGALFTHAYAAAPITLPSHATMLSGRYPPHHGARDNGIRMSAATPTLATVLQPQGFRTGAFVAAFPLDHQFGLERGFAVYSDRLPRDAMGRQANERPASAVVSEAIDWLGNPQSAVRQPQFFLWLHCFEPHAPYEGDPSRPVAERYDQEIATVDREIGRLLDALGPSLVDTLVDVAGDHGEAFGEHGEYAHSLFVYDTTLRVPLIISGPGIAPRRIDEPVTLADLAPTIARRLGVALPDADGIDLSPALAGRPLASRELYAESFAPLVEFGWAPLRSVRSGAWKYTAAPKPELFDLAHDAAEQQNVVAAHADVAQSLDARVNRIADDSLSAATGASNDATARLRALGYLSGPSIRNPQSAIRNVRSRSERRS